MALPPFLHPCNPTKPGYFNAVFQHRYPFGLSHALWWPAKLSTPETVILFIPGNPGLLDFYVPFLSSLYQADTTSKLAIFAHSHIGHTPGIEHLHVLPASRYGLTAQVEASIEAFDAIHSAFGIDTRVILVGHSVGAWVSLQVLKARPLAASAIFLLCPTISEMAKTPNGRRISWLFSPHMRTIVSKLSYLTRILPVWFLALLHPSWPLSQVLVLRTLLQSPRSILAALHMAHDEMGTIRDLDIDLLEMHRDQLWFYFAERDDWVGEQRENVLRSLKPDSENVRVVHGHHGIPHSFCINHGEQLALQCCEWLDDYRALQS
ncbi:putative lipid-droplet associated hydrolase [Lyophyllum shimeji]|uniref:Lipid-droplet associated hydrolase n=1 Tax=Lyophyllum shimeji TaxID=47721 RepID=A0A9P3PHE8_LYOSH|nr:putative lipid-droplet associated hydrolase [Lyophyllum shimeji]